MTGKIIPFGRRKPLNLLEKVKQFFVEDEWQFTPKNDQPVLRMGFQGDNGRWDCLARVREEEKQFCFYSILAALVPEEKRPAAAEYITRANYGMFMGNFEMDYNDGEVRYKTSIDVEDREDLLDTPVIRNIVYTNVTMMDRYFKGLMSVIYGDADPAAAVVQMESEE